MVIFSSNTLISKHIVDPPWGCEAGGSFFVFFFFLFFRRMMGGWLEQRSAADGRKQRLACWGRHEPKKDEKKRRKRGSFSLRGRAREGEGETELIWGTQVWPYWMFLLPDFLYFHFVFTFIIPSLPLLVLDVYCWGLDFVEPKLASLALFLFSFPFPCSLL